MNHLYLIKYLFNYENYQKYRHHIKINKDQKEVYYLYRVLDRLSDLLKSDISWHDFNLSVLTDLGNDYRPLLSQIESVDTNAIVVEAVLKTIRERDLAFELSKLSLEVAEGRKTLAELTDFYSKFDAVETEIKSPFYEWNLDEIYERTVNQPGLRWRLRSLNQSLGSLRKGDFGFIFARPETGKTTFLASEITYFAEQSTAPILWFNNEQAADLIPLRWVQASLGKTLDEIGQNKQEAYEQYKRNTKETIQLIDGAILHKRTIESIVKEYQPQCIAIDQLDKLKGFDSDRDDLRLGNIYIWARELAKEYCPVIGVCQADASAEGKKWLEMDNVANAKTAKQAEADWILGIGATHDPGFERIRFFNISKNKLLGDKDTDPAKRHGKIEVLIKPELARYQDI